MENTATVKTVQAAKLKLEAGGLGLHQGAPTSGTHGTHYVVTSAQGKELFRGDKKGLLAYTNSLWLAPLNVSSASAVVNNKHE